MLSVADYNREYYRKNLQENKKFRPKTHQKNIIDGIDIDEFKKDLNEMTRLEVANKYGVHFGTISKWKKKLGIDIRKNYLMPPEFEKDALTMDLESLAKKYGLSVQAIKTRVKRLGLDYGEKRAERFKKRIRDIVGDEYIVIGEYIDNKTQVEVRHNICGHEWEVIPGNFLYHDSRCPVCSGFNSKGDKAIRSYLNSRGYKYIEQYKFKDCYWKSPDFPLRFDFAVVNNNNIVCLIEYDGMQHFKPIKLFGGKKYFEEIKIKDAVKNEYCFNNKISLIRIPYTQLRKISEILDQKIGL